MAELFYPSGDVPLYPLPTAGNPSGLAGGDREMVPVVDEKGVVIGEAGREWVHGGSALLHPVVHIHIINHRGEFYLQKRAPGKDLYPGYWDTAVGGHVDFGETVAEALFREASEELGLSGINPVYLETYIYESESEREWVNVFALVGDFCPKPDAGEVSEGRYWTASEIEAAAGTGVFTPNFESEFARLREKIEALL